MARSQDKYFGAPVSLSDPANEAVPIVPGTALDDVARSIYVGTGGSLVMKGGDDKEWRTWKVVNAGDIIPFRVKAVRAEGTTAADMLALY